MSYWTEVFLAATTLENAGPEDGAESYPAVDTINVWLRENGWWDLFLVKPPKADQYSPDACFAGSFKNLDRDGFIKATRCAPWMWKERVQLFLRQEDDQGFQQIDLC